MNISELFSYDFRTKKAALEYIEYVLDRNYAARLVESVKGFRVSVLEVQA